ncbi:MAG: hypothetical protein AB7V04_00520 [Desulfomonilaceae bacterium]
MNFENIWARIQKETAIKTFTELANLVGTTSQYISRKRKENDFLVIWAFTVGQKFKLSTDWIMTGEEPGRLGEAQKRIRKFQILDEAEEWLTEQVEKDPDRENWFKVEFKKSFEEFKKWKEEKEEKEARENYTSSRKVA